MDQIKLVAKQSSNVDALQIALAKELSLYLRKTVSVSVLNISEVP